MLPLVALGAFTLDVAAAAVTSQDVVFDSRGVQVSGTLFVPEDSSALAAIVFVHGSGPQERSSALANWLASNGIATLTYDKRGVGAFRGVYEGEDNTSSSNLEICTTTGCRACRSDMLVLARQVGSFLSRLGDHPMSPLWS